MRRAVTSGVLFVLAGVLAALAGVFATPCSAATLPDRDEHWLTVDSDNFTLVTNAAAQIAREVTLNMEALHSAILALNPGLKPRYRIPTTVLVFADEASFRPYRTAPDGSLMRVAGLFVAHPLENFIALSADAGHDPYPVIYHEYVHYLMKTLFPPLPLWLDEGLAEYYSSLQIFPDGIALGQALGQHVLWLQEHPLLALDDLFALGQSDDSYNEGRRRGTFYAQSWALVHYLLRDDPTRLDRIAYFIQRLDDGDTQETAIEAAFGVSTHGLLQALRAYTMQARYDSEAAVRLPARESAAAPVSDMPRAAALAHLGSYLALGNLGRAGVAEEHLHAAMDANPGAARATLGLGLLRARDGLLEEAVALFEAALLTEPDNALAALLLGQTLIKRHQRDVPTETSLAKHLRPTAPLPEALRRARQVLQRIHDRDLLQADDHAALGYTFLWDPGPAAAGIQALERARALQPRRPEWAYHLAVLHLRSGHREQADALFDLIERHVPDTALATQVGRVRVFEALREVDDMLHNGKLDAAHALLEALGEQTVDNGFLEIIDEKLRLIEDFQRRARESGDPGVGVSNRPG